MLSAQNPFDQRVVIRYAWRGSIKHQQAHATLATRDETALPVFVPMREFVGIVRIAALEDSLTRGLFLRVHPDHANLDIVPNSELGAIEQFALANFA